MQTLTERHAKSIKGTLGCFDRIVLFGAFQSIGHAQAMSKHLRFNGIRLVDYSKTYANELRVKMVETVKARAAEQGEPIRHVDQSTRKEALVEGILKRRKRRSGLVRVLSAMESCSCNKCIKNHDSGFLELRYSRGKCLHYYIYWIDDEYGLCYLRIPTWAPFRLQTLVQGRRVKHALGSTSIKMYDKHERVLRIETTTSDVTSFTHYRKVASGSPGSHPYRWAPIRKALANLPALCEAMGACNRCYLEYISGFEDRTQERHKLSKVTETVRDDKLRSYRGVNFFAVEDLRFLQAILRGERNIRGLRNRDLQAHLPGWTAQKIGRTLRRFKQLGLLKKVGGTVKYYITSLGKDVLAAALQLRERVAIPSLRTA